MRSKWSYGFAMTAAVVCLTATTFAGSPDEPTVSPSPGDVPAIAPPTGPGGPGPRAWEPGGLRQRPGMGGGPGGMGDMAQDVMTRFDTDQSGNLDLEEYLNHQRELFATADLNGDQRLDQMELNLVTRPGPDPAATQPFAPDPAQRRMMMGGMLKRLDVNGDGKISEAEAVSMPRIAEQFSALDTNKDKFIDATEMQAAQSKLEQLRRSGPGAGLDDSDLRQRQGGREFRDDRSGRSGTDDSGPDDRRRGRRGEDDRRSD